MTSASTTAESGALATPATRWIQLIICILCMVLIANLQYGWTLFVNPINKAHPDWSLAEIQLAFSIFIALETWLTPIEGWIADSLGPRRSLEARGLVLMRPLDVSRGGFPVAHVRTMEEVMGHSTDRENFNMLLLTIFGVVALVLAAIGIYGLMAYTVTQRNQEMGIRMALGADRSAIRRLVVWSGMRLAIAGIAVGTIGAFALTRLMSSFLFGVRPWDPVAFLSAPLILGVVALLAVWLPGLRAGKIDPVEALRAE